MSAGLVRKAVVAAAALYLATLVSADTWRLGSEQSWQRLSAEKDKFLLAVAEAKKLVNVSDVQAAKEAYAKLKQDFPEIAGPDFDEFVKAELLFARGKFTQAFRQYEKLLNDYPDSELYEAVLQRQFEIGTAYLAGQSRYVLKVIRLKGYPEGVRIMEKIIDRAGFFSPIGIKAAVALAEHYERRQKFNEAYLQWHEISTHWLIGKFGKQALLGMARCKHALYLSHPEQKRAFYDASCLVSAKSYYQKFQLLYPEQAKELGIDKIIAQIDEQIAHKQLTIGLYYHRTGKVQAANLYFDMVARDWPGTKAAELAKQMRSKQTGNISSGQNR